MTRQRAASPDPRRLDMAAAAEAGVRLEGQWPLADFERLLDGAPAPGLNEPDPPPEVAWSAQASLRPVKGGAPEVWLRLTAQATVPQTCQRCLQPVAVPLALDRRLRFVADEAEAAALDAESEDDVLPLLRALDLRELVEDELLLALPLVPRHGACPQPLQLTHPAEPEAGASDAGDLARPHPFAALAALKRRPS